MAVVAVVISFCCRMVTIMIVSLLRVYQAIVLKGNHVNPSFIWEFFVEKETQ